MFAVIKVLQIIQKTSRIFCTRVWISPIRTLAPASKNLAANVPIVVIIITIKRIIHIPIDGDKMMTLESCNLPSIILYNT